MSSPETSSSPCLILTATVQVKEGMVLTERRDTNTRLDDYKRALGLWLACPDVKTLVLVENSGYELSELAAIANQFPGKEVEFLSFTAPAFDGALGKGYGEMLCLEHCLRHSKLLARSPRFLKITGRYFLANASTMIQFVQSRTESAIICDLLLNLSWADSRAFGGDTDFLRNYLCPLRDQLNDSVGSTFEHVLARGAHYLMANSGIWSLPPFVLQIRGVSASQGRTWGDGLLPTWKRRVRQALLAKLLHSRPR